MFQNPYAQAASVFHTTSYPVDRRDYFHEVKQPERKADCMVKTVWTPRFLRTPVCRET